MSYVLIVADWNGTCFRYPTDEALNKKIGYAVLDNAKRAIKRGNVLQAVDVARLLLAKYQLKKRLKDYKAEKIPIQEVYEPFNRHVLSGTKVSLVERATHQYARETNDMVDPRVLRPLRKADARKAILSTSYDYSIEMLLKESGFDGVFDDIVANRLISDGETAVGFTTGIYGRKPDILQNLQEKFFGISRSGSGQDIRPDKTLYIGDSAEDDAPVAKILPPGHFIVPFFATDGFKQDMAVMHKAFVPSDETDLDRYLALK